MSLHYGLFKIIDKSYGKNSLALYKIQFLKTGYITTTTKQTILNGNVKDKWVYKLYIGKIYTNKSGKLFKIIRYSGINDKHRYTFDVLFINSNIIVYNVDIYNIKCGKVRDPSIMINNILFKHGDSEYRRNFRSHDKKLYRTLQHRWCSMIDRCYNLNNSSYKNYGALGIKVDDRWHTFSNYLSDVITLPGFNRDLILLGKLELDKDKLQKNKKSSEKVYSKDTCCWLPLIENNHINMKKNR